MKLFLALCAFFMTGCGVVSWVYPPMNVYIKENDGKALLAEAEYSRQAQIADAKAKQEAAIHLAAAEIARAEGVAKANAIIGTSLKNNEEYLRWLFIEQLNHGKNSEIIYIPTEAGLPILGSRQAG